MKKIIFLLMVGVLFIGTNLYAAGDLIVNGQVGIGTAVPLSKLDIATANTNGLNVTTTQTTDLFAESAALKIEIDGSTQLTSSKALYVNVTHIGTDSDLPIIRGGQFQYMFRSVDAGDSNFGQIYGLDSVTRDHWSNARNYTGSVIAGLRLQTAFEGTGTITVTDLSGALVKNPSVGGSALQATNLYGMQIEKQTQGTNNYGIALNGDGEGADIVFGDAGGACRPGIYSIAGYVKAVNKDCIESPVSPHDPETGEWIFYSKNVKTGKMVKVNMEKLVKAVEKLTGEKFTIETMEEIQ